ncbi:hypothetical protein [Bacillus sp. 3255]|uniref:hypothetical protein n=1 Tax=Bacillus sp. 3255 TaxID=2817904 RepID=UPI002859699F|nr:hypothetical protein [Bacillus sp. 3255]MDR6883564.1 hypothetical protein [Bacillus sp. 3255]
MRYLLVILSFILFMTGCSVSTNQKEDEKNVGQQAVNNKLSFYQSSVATFVLIRSKAQKDQRTAIKKNLDLFLSINEDDDFKSKVKDYLGVWDKAVLTQTERSLFEEIGNLYVELNGVAGALASPQFDPKIVSEQRNQYDEVESKVVRYLEEIKP